MNEYQHAFSAAINRPVAGRLRTNAEGLALTVEKFPEIARRLAEKPYAPDVVRQIRQGVTQQALDTVFNASTGLLSQAAGDVKHPNHWENLRKAIEVVDVVDPIIYRVNNVRDPSRLFSVRQSTGIETNSSVVIFDENKATDYRGLQHQNGFFRIAGLPSGIHARFLLDAFRGDRYIPMAWQRPGEQSSLTLIMKGNLQNKQEIPVLVNLSVYQAELLYYHVSKYIADHPEDNLSQKAVFLHSITEQSSAQPGISQMPKAANAGQARPDPVPVIRQSAVQAESPPVAAAPAQSEAVLPEGVETYEVYKKEIETDGVIETIKNNVCFVARDGKTHYRDFGDKQDMRAVHLDSQALPETSLFIPDSSRILKMLKQPERGLNSVQPALFVGDIEVKGQDRRTRRFTVLEYQQRQFYGHPREGRGPTQLRLSLFLAPDLARAVIESLQRNPRKTKGNFMEELYDIYYPPAYRDTWQSFYKPDKPADSTLTVCVNAAGIETTMFSVPFQ